MAATGCRWALKEPLNNETLARYLRGNFKAFICIRTSRRLTCISLVLTFKHCPSSMMIVILATLFCILPFAAGHFRAVCPKPAIEVVEGDDISLQCRLNHPVNLSTLTVDWKRFNKVVHACRRKYDQPDAQMPRYRNRTSLNHEDLDDGVVTLLISSAQLSDSGPYRCYVPKLEAGCTVEVTVVKKDQQNRTKTSDSNTSGPPVEEVTRPDNQDAAEMEAVSPKVVGGAVGAVLAVAAVVGGVLLILVKLGKIRVCKRRREEMRPNNNNYKMGKAEDRNNRGDQHSSL